MSALISTGGNLLNNLFGGGQAREAEQARLRGLSDAMGTLRAGEQAGLSELNTGQQQALSQYEGFGGLTADTIAALRGEIAGGGESAFNRLATLAQERQAPQLAAAGLTQGGIGAELSRRTLSDLAAQQAVSRQNFLGNLGQLGLSASGQQADLIRGFSGARQGLLERTAEGVGGLQAEGGMVRGLASSDVGKFGNRALGNLFGSDGFTGGQLGSLFGTKQPEATGIEGILKLLRGDK